MMTFFFFSGFPVVKWSDIFDISLPNTKQKDQDVIFNLLTSGSRHPDMTTGSLFQRALNPNMSNE